MNLRRALLPLLALLVAGFFLKLGFWQLQRLEWKEQLLADITRAVEGKAAPFDLLAAAARFSADPGADYLPVTVSGRVAGPVQYLYAVVDGKPGWSMVARLETADGPSVLVDFGAIPAEMRGTARLPEGPVEIRGFARRPLLTGGWFAPQSKPEKYEFFWRDVPAMAAGADVVAFLVERAPQAGEAGYPRAGLPDPSAIPNNHLGYALTWFALAGLLPLLAVTFLLTGRKSST